jgi:hypothetical protein
MLQPAGYIRGPCRRAWRRMASSIHERSPVDGAAPRGPGLAGRDARGPMSPRRDGDPRHGQRTSRKLRLPETGRLMQLFLYRLDDAELDADALARLGGRRAGASRRLTRWAPRCAGSTADRAATGSSHAPAQPCVRDEGQRRRRCARGHPVMQRRKFDERFPQLAGLKPEYEWAGHLCLTLNGVSVMRELEARAFFGLRTERPRHRARHAHRHRRGRACLRNETSAVTSPLHR